MRPVPGFASTVTPVKIPWTGTAGFGAGSGMVIKLLATGVTVPFAGAGGRGGEGGGGGGRIICTPPAVAGFVSGKAKTATFSPWCWARKFVFHSAVPREN